MASFPSLPTVVLKLDSSWQGDCIAEPGKCIFSSDGRGGLSVHQDVKHIAQFVDDQKRETVPCECFLFEAGSETMMYRRLGGESSTFRLEGVSLSTPNMVGWLAGWLAGWQAPMT